MSEAYQLCLTEQWSQSSTPPRTAQSRLQRVTEVVLPQSPDICATLLLPMLEHLSAQQPERWITWVGHCPLPRTALQPYPLARQRLRRLPATSDSQVLHYAARAMDTGTSQTVIVALDRTPSEAGLTSLERAARQGTCFGLILRRWG